MKPSGKVWKAFVVTYTSTRLNEDFTEIYSHIESKSLDFT